jgi:hypothetical protein
MAEDTVSLQDIQQEVEKIRKTLGDLRTINDQLNKPRSVACIIFNLTDAPLTFAGSHHDHGGFATTPPPIINAHSGGAFGSQSDAGAIATGTEGYVNYTRPGAGVRFYWDNPWLGKNGSDATLSPGTTGFQTWSVTGSGDQKAEMQFVLLQPPPSPPPPPPPKKSFGDVPVGWWSKLTKRI